VYLVQGSQDTAARVVLTGSQQMARSLAGKLAAVSADGKTLSLETPNLRRGEGRQLLTIDIKLTDKTKVIYDGVAKDGAKPTVGYAVRVELADGSEDTADKIYLAGPDRAGRR
jgi:hypothetical protein